MKRPMSLVACILNICAAVCYLAYQFLVALILFDLLKSASSIDTEGLIMIALMLSSLLIAVIAIIFNAVSISAWNKTHEKYKTKRKLITTTLTFSYFLFILILIRLILSAGSNVVADIFVLIAIFVSNILLILDLALENRRARKMQERELAKENEKAEEDRIVQKESDEENTEEKIEKLGNLKEQGLINEEEYNEMVKPYKSEEKIMKIK